MADATPSGWRIGRTAMAGEDLMGGLPGLRLTIARSTRILQLPGLCAGNMGRLKLGTRRPPAGREKAGAVQLNLKGA